MRLSVLFSLGIQAVPETAPPGQLFMTIRFK